MAQLIAEQLKEILDDFADPETGRGLVRAGQLRDVRITESAVEVRVGFSRFVAPLWNDLAAQVAQHLRNRIPTPVDVHVEVIEHPRPAEQLEPVGLAVKAVIAVAAGKGGVGKSTVAALLAFGLKRLGARAGLLDADVFGPSIPHLLGCYEQPVVRDGKIQPVFVDGLPVLSMGFLVPREEAVIWRGPMIHNVLLQFLRDTSWGELDYLIVDMPPGTGDVAISISQIVPLAGAVIVCTPQELALADAVKAVTMFRRVNVPVMGIVENMSYFVCPSCGSRHEIFGHGGARTHATALGVPFLAEIPLNVELRIRGDQGSLISCLAHPHLGEEVANLCRRLVQEVINERRRHPPLPQLRVLS